MLVDVGVAFRPGYDESFLYRWVDKLLETPDTTIIGLAEAAESAIK